MASRVLRLVRLWSLLTRSLGDALSIAPSKAVSAFSRSVALVWGTSATVVPPVEGRAVDGRVSGMSGRRGTAI